MPNARGLLLAGAAALPVAIGATVVVGVHEPASAGWAAPWVAFYLAGAFAHRRLPRDRAARRLLALGTVSLIWFAGGLVLAIAYRHAGPGTWLVAPNTVLKGLDLALPAALLALLAVYPDGCYQRTYERMAVRIAVALAIVVPVGLLVTRPEVQPTLVLSWVKDYAGPVPHVSSPLHTGALDWLGAALAFYGQAAIAILCIPAVAILALRFRRAPAPQRRQISWPLAAALIAALQPVAEAFDGVNAISDAPIIAALVALPVALAIGLLRPELFDVGRAVRRSLAYLVLWAVIGAAYVGGAAAAGIAAGGRNLQLAVAASIAATLAFGPAYRALSRQAARWAYGARPTRAELVRRLGATLEHTLDPAELPGALASTIREGLGVEWVRMAIPGLAPVVDGREPAPGEPPAAEAPLPGGGALQCGRALGGVDGELLATLARQAALALGNARLAAELQARARELAASRTRIVEAEERGRRRIERDIHDGVQQELAALIARIGLARQQLGGDPELVRATLGDLQAEARQALADLRELAGGIHPSVLGDRGIVEAIEGRAARLPLGVTIECDPGLRTSRFSPTLEGAVYFLVCEGFANALKHSGAERVTVRLGRADGALTVELADDGRGFDPAVTRGTGLDGLADRTEALGGDFAVRSHPGAGTRLLARFPVALPAPAGR